MKTLLKNSHSVLEIVRSLSDRRQRGLDPAERALLEQVAIELLSVSRSPARSATVSSEAVSLSPRESEVAGWISQGLTDGEIAAVLGISTRTVNTHRDNLLRKLNVRSRASIAAWVAANRMLAGEGVPT